MLGLRGIRLCRQFHNSGITTATNKALLSKLRKKTGFPFVTCRKALQKFDNDLKQAEAWMREEAQKQGWEKATKLQERPMSHGLVGILQENKVAAMVELNCETDFVARNVQFQGLVKKAVAACLQHGTDSGKTKLQLDKDIGETLSCDGKSLSDLVALEIGNLGENMLLRRAVYLAAMEEDSHLGLYVHSAGTSQGAMEKFQLGKYGSLVIFKQISPPPGAELSTEELGRQLGQHVVGMNPTKIGSIAEDPEEEQDKENGAIAEDPKKEQDKENGPIAEDPEEEQDKAEENAMIFQEFLLDSTMTVKEFLEENKAQVVDFVRFECGEELEEKETETKEQPENVPGAVSTGEQAENVQ